MTLYKNARTLYDLWQEYEFEIGGMKPAKLYTRAERGKNKSLYSRRNLFWQQVVRMVNAGHSSDSAIDAIYRVLGVSLSVTKILHCLLVAKRTGGHSALT